MADRIHAAERTRQAIAAAQDGQIADARTLLAEALTLDPDYQIAWMWFAAVAEDPGEQKYCLERVRDLDPLRRPSAALNRLGSITATSPPELIPIIDPDPPSFIKDYAAQFGAARRRRVRNRIIVVAVVLALLGAFVAIGTSQRLTYTSIALVVGDEEVGPQGGRERIAAARAAVEAWNDGAPAPRQLRLEVFNDGGDPQQAAQVAQEIVEADRFIGVIGHGLSSTSLAAAPLYEAAGLPAITAAATADDVTADRQWYFRTVFDNSQQGSGMAVYAHGVQDFDRAVSVATDDAYGQSLRAGFVGAFEQLGTVAADITVPAGPEGRDEALRAAAREIAELPQPVVIALSALDPQVSLLAEELVALGVQPRIIGSDALAGPEFFQGLAQASRSAVNRAVVAVPLTAGTLQGPAVTFYDQLARELGFIPSWTAGLTYDAVDAFAQAMLRGAVPWGERPTQADRTLLRDALDSARDSSSALPVLTGALWFEPDNAAARQVSFDDGRINSEGEITVDSAAYQITPYSPTAGVSLEEEVEAGTAFTALGTDYTIQRVVTVGVNINSVSDFKAGDQTFKADLFVWFKYRGSPEGPSDIVLANAVVSLPLAEPQRVSEEDGQRYELYRIQAQFRGTFDFRRFPFDSQLLPITLQNRTLPSSKLSYVPDADNLAQSQDERLASGVDAGATIDQIPNWEADAVRFFPTSVGNTGALGDPTLEATSQGVTFSQYVAATEISRDVASFLTKNLLPIFLLTLVTYVSLWYPYKDATARISFGVTGILTGAVMLNSVTSSLPSVDYTVAIEWAYYAFLLLAGLCILSTLVGRQLTEDRQLAKVRALDRTMRIGYPVYVGAVVLAYLLLF
jgi:ABC-type branched-subunit amino acid transport system substrate-binding protein